VGGPRRARRLERRRAPDRRLCAPVPQLIAGLDETRPGL
jgi:hypothetical protein